MYGDGIVHDIIWDKFSGHHFHLELHCVPCNVRRYDLEECKTNSWFTKAHLNRVLTTLSPIVTNHLIEEAEETNETLDKHTEPKNVEIVEDEDMRLAVIFGPDSWSHHRMKIIRPKENENDARELDDSFCDNDNDEQAWRLNGSSNGKDGSIRLSSNRIVAVVAINDPNASCLERASVSHSIYEIINKYTNFKTNGDGKNKKAISKYFPKRSKRKQTS